MTDARHLMIRRQLRVIAILRAAYDASLVPLRSEHLHTIGYFADALAPVWDIQILDSQLLKRRAGPLMPALQTEVDRLVGVGIVIPANVQHQKDVDGIWRLTATYRLNSAFAEPIMARARAFSSFAAEFSFVRETVLAMSRLELVGIASAASSDASYGDVLIDFGGLVDIASIRGRFNQTAATASRFGQLLEADVALSPAELVHLYVRELQKRLVRAA
jgi:hypothetical protein